MAFAYRKLADKEALAKVISTYGAQFAKVADFANAGAPKLEERRAVVESDDTTLVAHTVVRDDAWYADTEGRMPAWIGLELMAQAIAAHVGLLSMRAGEPMRPGVLLGSRRYTAHHTSFERDACLRIRVVELLRS